MIKNLTNNIVFSLTIAGITITKIPKWLWSIFSIFAPFFIFLIMQHGINIWWMAGYSAAIPLHGKIIIAIIPSMFISSCLLELRKFCLDLFEEFDYTSILKNKTHSI